MSPTPIVFEDHAPSVADGSSLRSCISAQSILSSLDHAQSLAANLKRMAAAAAAGDRAQSASAASTQSVQDIQELEVSR